MFRLRLAKNNEFEMDEPWMVVNYKWDLLSYTLTQKKNGFTIKTNDLIIEGTLIPFKLKVYNKQNQLIHADAKFENTIGYKGDTAYCHKQLFADEHFFGFGERMDFIDQRGKMVELDLAMVPSG